MDAYLFRDSLVIKNISLCWVFGNYTLNLSTIRGNVEFVNFEIFFMRKVCENAIAAIKTEVYVSNASNSLGLISLVVCKAVPKNNLKRHRADKHFY